jgi:hypothetical protein
VRQAAAAARQAVVQQVVGQQVVGQQAVVQQAVVQQVVGQQAVGQQAVGQQVVGQQAVGQQAFVMVSVPLLLPLLPASAARQAGCGCTSSRCRTKLCGCFKAGRLCSESCQCSEGCCNVAAMQ